MFTGPRKSREQEVRYSRPGHGARVSLPIHGRPQPAVVPDDPPTRHARAKTERPLPAAGRSVGDLMQRYDAVAECDTRGRAAVRLEAVR
jgi:hypothetical protein